MQIKTQYYLTTVRVAIHGHCQEDTQITSVGEDVEKRKHSCTVGGNVNWCSHYGKQNGAICKKIKNRTTIQSRKSTSGYLSK